MKKQQETENKGNEGARGTPSPGNKQAPHVACSRPSLTFATAYELAELLRLNVQTVWKLARRGELPYYDFGRGNKRFDVEEAITYRRRYNRKDKTVKK
ncbi:MAG: helix-turn-helix domain-containing protein [Actinobacteria bacterium]|nr:helix-turn-helix domain-containing protein [Actinomycetota bacterium]MCG2820256.1 helix-turn-helix domain-containing protein [Actinomycetes bacterium]MBU4219562.1 helix-turn-helix domain-containing protein [Actinomycetota bacterium]MBU4358130.1 helix-turn-helix domain-containing protein [Actinomycetota bacterium]MBU4392352.1 helix-turn-helix domain-containing protein [Actinomycetota bacterium]